MTLEDAEKIAVLIGYADHACNNCVGDLVEHANRLLPGFVFEATEETTRDEWPATHTLYANRIVVKVRPR